MERDTRDGKETMEDPGNVEGDRGPPKYPGSDTGHRWSAYWSFKSLYLGYRVVWSAPLWTVSDQMSELRWLPARASVQNLGKRRADPAQLATWFSFVPPCSASVQVGRCSFLCAKAKSPGGREKKTQTEPDPNQIRARVGAWNPVSRSLNKSRHAHTTSK